MKKVFISQPMRGLKDEEILKARTDLDEEIKESTDNAEETDSKK